METYFFAELAFMVPAVYLARIALWGKSAPGPGGGGEGILAMIFLGPAVLWVLMLPVLYFTYPRRKNTADTLPAPDA